MDHWNPRPLNKPDINGLFQMDERVTIVKSVETPMQRQRRIDGTPHTITGVMCDRPEGPSLTLDSLEKSYSITAKDDDKEPCDADAVMKAYLEQE